MSTREEDGPRTFYVSSRIKEFQGVESLDIYVKTASHIRKAAEGKGGEEKPLLIPETHRWLTNYRLTLVIAITSVIVVVLTVIAALR
jgi:hypothetical protein